MFSEKEIFERSARLLGDEFMDRLGRIRVIVFGVGGVGSWCVESLVRTGLRHITIVDCDKVSVTNINRQLMATTETVGREKVDVLRERLLSINPSVDVSARCEVFSAANADTFNLDSYDYVVDAIDSLKDKVALIELATRSRCNFFSSMGAALKLDPTRIRVDEFSRVVGCPLARALRQRFKKLGCWPRKKFLCVFSDELLPNLGATSESLSSLSPLTGGAAPSHKAQINGSLMHITAIFGLTLAGLIIRDVKKRLHEFPADE